MASNILVNLLESTDKHDNAEGVPLSSNSVSAANACLCLLHWHAGSPPLSPLTPISLDCELEAVGCMPPLSLMEPNTLATPAASNLTANQIWRARRKRAKGQGLSSLSGDAQLPNHALSLCYNDVTIEDVLVSAMSLPATQGGWQCQLVRAGPSTLVSRPTKRQKAVKFEEQTGFPFLPSKKWRADELITMHRF